VLKTSAFTPSEAQEINTFLLSEAERLINDINDRAREDLITFASNEVKAAEEKAKAAALAVSDFRNQEGVVDPEAQTQLHFEQISRLQEELIKTRAQLTQLRVFAPESPHPPALELRARTLDSEIAAEMEKISGGDDSLASKAAEFQRLNLERQFADQQLAAALASLETARNEAQRQQLYLETISKPSFPDDATQPKRLRSILTTLALSAIAWGIIAMLVAGVREHQA
jgi:capsular polysaccharide transport system permease protein